MQNHLSSILATLGAVSLLVACGGGGGSTTGSVPTPVPNPPAATNPTSVAIVGTVSPDNYAASSNQKQAYDYLNAQRQQCGFGLLQQSATLDTAAQGHASYLATNNITGHYQNHAQFPQEFTGADLTARLAGAGYPETKSTEVVSATSNTSFGTNLGRSSIMDLFTMPYHGLGMLMSFRDVGFGYAVNNATAIPHRLVGNFGTTSTRPVQLLGESTVATYPCNGMTNILSQSYGSEDPTPIPGRDIAAHAQPIGHPIYIKVRDGQTLVLTSRDLRVSGGNTSLPLLTLTKANDVKNLIPDQSSVMLMPDVPLAKNTTYLFTASGTNNGQPVNVSFTFSTGAF